MKRLLSILLAVVLIAMAIPATVSAAGVREYKITIHTGNEWGAGTDDQVIVAFKGTNGTTGRLYLDKPGDDFEANTTETYTVVGKDVGTVTSIIIEIDNGPAGNTGGGSWKLDWFAFEGITYTANMWMDNDDTNYVIFFVTGQDVVADKHSVTIRTANEWDAGTDAFIYIQLVGTRATSSWHLMDNYGNDFEPGDEDTYEFTVPDIGAVTGINIHSENGNYWSLEWVKYNGRQYDVNQWLYNNGVKITNITGDYSVSAVSGERVEAEIYALSASTFSSPDIWFIVSGGVLMLAVAAFAVIFVQRRKKKAIIEVDGSNRDN